LNFIGQLRRVALQRGNSVGSTERCVLQSFGVLAQQSRNARTSKFTLRQTVDNKTNMTNFSRAVSFAKKKMNFVSHTIDRHASKEQVCGPYKPTSIVLLESIIRDFISANSYAGLDLARQIYVLAYMELERGNEMRALNLFESAIELAGGAGGEGDELRGEIGSVLDKLREKMRVREADPDEMKSWLNEVAQKAGTQQSFNDVVLGVCQGRWDRLAHILQVPEGVEGEPLPCCQQGRNAQRKLVAVSHIMDSELATKYGLPSDLVHALSDNLPPAKVNFRAHGSNHFVFTSPHGTYVVRNGTEVHLSENYANYAAFELARVVGGSFFGWSLAETFRSSETKLARLKAYDPNHLPTSAEEQPGDFHATLRGTLQPWMADSVNSFPVHFDCHGRRNWKEDGIKGAVTIGVGAMQRYAELVDDAPFTSEEILKTRDSIVAHLQDALGPEWSVNVDPKYAGAGKDTIRTMTRQSVELCHGKIMAVQLEMSRDFRCSLVIDSALMERFANGLRTVKF